MKTYELENNNFIIYYCIRKTLFYNILYIVYENNRNILIHINKFLIKLHKIKLNNIRYIKKPGKPRANYKFDSHNRFEFFIEKK